MVFQVYIYIYIIWTLFVYNYQPYLFLNVRTNLRVDYADYADYANGSGLDLSLPKFAVAGLVDTTKPDKGHDFSSIPWVQVGRPNIIRG